MNFRTRTGALLLFSAAAATASAADGGADTPPRVPVTRTELKQALENSKASRPRLPLPPLSEAETEKAAKGDWSVVNNGRMRRYYLLPEFTGAGFTREPDKGMTLGNAFQTMIFWVVSRGNNCTYCLGHQESKLAAAGVGEDKVAALDGDWSEFTPKERAALGLARTLTFEPYKVGAADLDRLRPDYTDAQILEVVFVTANFNAMNRWTGALKIPQEKHREYLTPTADRYRDLVSKSAPLTRNGPDAGCAAPSNRPALESRAEAESAIAAARSRTPRLPLTSEADARAVLPAGRDAKAGSVPQWVRLLANFPKAGGARVAMHAAAEEKGRLAPKLRAEVAYVAARDDRAWYAVDQARRRLNALGLSDDDVFALDKADSQPAPTRAALAFARKLTTDPALITDADVAGLRTLYSDHEVAELVHLVTEAAFFDRVTEAAGLKVED